MNYTVQENKQELDVWFVLEHVQAISSKSWPRFCDETPSSRCDCLRFTPVMTQELWRCYSLACLFSTLLGIIWCSALMNMHTPTLLLKYSWAQYEWRQGRFSGLQSKKRTDGNTTAKKQIRGGFGALERRLSNLNTAVIMSSHVWTCLWSHSVWSAITFEWHFSPSPLRTIQESVCLPVSSKSSASIYSPFKKIIST